VKLEGDMHTCTVASFLEMPHIVERVDCVAVVKELYTVSDNKFPLLGNPDGQHEDTGGSDLNTVDAVRDPKAGYNSTGITDSPKDLTVVRHNGKK
jgi:hypothetical protein